MPPFRLYIFAGIAFFGVMAATGGGPLRLAIASSEEGSVIQLAGGMGRIDVGGAGSRFERVRESPEDFNAAVFAALSYAHFLLLPIFALLAKPFWRRRYYIEHLVFATHLEAFALLFGAVLVAFLAWTGTDGPAGSVVSTAAGPLLVGYLFLAAQRFYGGRWWITLPKVLVFTWLTVMIAVAGVLLVALATMALF